MLPNTSLEPASPSDLTALIEWVPDEKACRLWGGPNVRYPMTPATLREDLAGDDRASYVLVGEDGERVAFGQVVRPEAKRVHLARLIVAPPRRGEGLGTRLCLRLVQQACRERLPEVISLNVYRENARARALYEGLGFTEAGSELKDAIHMRAPAGHALRMALRRSSRPPTTTNRNTEV